MGSGNPLGQGIAFPPRLDPGGQVAWSSGPDNIRESILIILMTNRQERVMRPNFGAGLRTFLYEPNTASIRRLIQERVIQSLARWEPRITLSDVTVEADKSDSQSVIITLQYLINSSGAQDQLTVRVPVAAANGGD